MRGGEDVFDAFVQHMVELPVSRVVFGPLEMPWSWILVLYIEAPWDSFGGGDPGDHLASNDS